MASTDARPVPIKNTAFRITFAMRLNTGAVNSGAAGVTALVSKDAGTFVACTNAPVEIATASGVYSLDLLAAEMNGDCVALQVKSTTPNAVPVVLVFFPQKAGSIPVDVDTVKQSSTAAAAQQALADTALSATVDTTSYTPTLVDFDTSLTAVVATDFYKGRSVLFITGGLANQAARITGSTYQNGKVRLAVTQLTSVPVSGSALRIV
jgi:hypothetical protein